MSRFRFAVLGENISYSKSPEIFSAIFEQYGCEGDTEVHSINRNDLEKTVTKLRSSGVNGISVTIPFKSEILQFLDEFSPEARQIEAVNSVSIQNGRAIGYNTDIFGFAFTLQKLGFEKIERDVLLLGCGGSSRAVSSAFYTEFGVRRLHVASRSLQRRADFAGTMEKALEGLSIKVISLEQINSLVLSPALAVNCTPVGGPNQSDTDELSAYIDFEHIKYYFDLNYNSDNPMLAAARKSGCSVIDGSVMLVAQAVRSFELWTGKRVDFDPVYDRVFGNASRAIGASD